MSEAEVLALLKLDGVTREGRLWVVKNSQEPEAASALASVGVRYDSGHYYEISRRSPQGGRKERET